MIKINLLPREVYAARAQKQIQTAGIAVGVILFVGLLGYYASLFVRSQALTKDLSVANAELRKYEAIDAEVKAFQQQESALSSRYSVIQQLLKGTLTYPKFYEDFMALLPPDIWVTRVTTVTDEAYRLSVTVDARALSSFAVADWLTNLQQARSLVSNVSLGEIRVDEATEDSPAIYSFTMTFSYQWVGN